MDSKTLGETVLLLVFHLTTTPVEIISVRRLIVEVLLVWFLYPYRDTGMGRSSPGTWFPPQYVALTLNQPVEDVPAKITGT